MQWIKLINRMPNPDEHDRVLIYTEGYDFNGEQVFDVKTETLNECFYADPEDQPEVCKAASHWMPHPSNSGSPNWTDEEKAANALRDLMDALLTGMQMIAGAYGVLDEAIKNVQPKEIRGADLSTLIRMIKNGEL